MKMRSAVWEFFLSANIKKNFLHRNVRKQLYRISVIVYNVFMKHIQSLQHNIVKHLVKLRENREYRSQCRTVLISGIKLIKELASMHRFKTVFVIQDSPLNFAIDTEQTYIITPSIMKKITGLPKPECIAAEIAIPEEHHINNVSYLLILDGISDPGNMGTLLRTALALGWEGVLITPNSADPFNDKALRAAKGATFKLPLHHASFEEIEHLLTSSQYSVLAADMHGTPMHHTSIRPPIALVLGNEAHGLSPSIHNRAHCIAIPMKKEMESLNVACAGAILMQFLREPR